MLNLTDDEKRTCRDAFVAAFGENGSTKREQVVKEMCATIGAMLQQEYRIHNREWWLFTLGTPARRLAPEEIADAKLLPVS